MKRLLLILSLLFWGISAQAQQTVPPPQAATEQRLASIEVYRANIRSAPNLDSLVITVVEIGERFPIVGTNEDNTWWQIALRGTTGWVRGDLVAVINADGTPLYTRVREAQIIELSRQFAQSNAIYIGVPRNLNVRRGPGTNFGIVGRIPYDQQAILLGRNQFATWWFVEWAGLRGWVSGAHVALPPDLNFNSIPLR